MAETIKIEGGTYYIGVASSYVYSFNRSEGLNEYGDVNLAEHVSVYFDPPTDDRPPEIGDFLDVVTTREEGPGRTVKTAVFRRREGYQVTEGRMRWPKDPDMDYRVDWEEDTKDWK